MRDSGKMRLESLRSASIQPRTSHLIFIILAASRDLIFTERLSPEEVHVSLQEDGYLEKLLRRKDSFDLYFDLVDGPKPYIFDPEMRRTEQQSDPRTETPTSSKSPLVRSEVNSELNFPSNFEGLVLGCIDADFCK